MDALIYYALLVYGAVTMWRAADDRNGPKVLASIFALLVVIYFGHIDHIF